MITAADLLKQAKKKIARDRGYKHSTEQAQSILLKGLEDYYKLRKKWSWLMIIWISVLILFNITVTFFVGKEWLVYEDPWFINSIMLETFVQIVALGTIAVFYLFRNTPYPSREFDEDETEVDEKPK